MKIKKRFAVIIKIAFAAIFFVLLNSSIAASKEILPQLNSSNNASVFNKENNQLAENVFNYIPGDIIVKYKTKNIRNLDTVIGNRQKGKVSFKGVVENDLSNEIGLKNGAKRKNKNNKDRLIGVAKYRIPNLATKSLDFINEYKRNRKKGKRDDRAESVMTSEFGQVIVNNQAENQIDPYTKEIISSLKSNPDVEYAEVNKQFHVLLTPNDTYFSKMWNLENTGQAFPYSGISETTGTNDADIDAASGWDVDTTGGGQGVIVAVVDTGIDYTHEDIGACTLQQINDGIASTCPKFVPGYDFINNDNDPMDDHGHGTHVAGTIAATRNNGLGITGIAPNVKLMAVKGLNSSGSGDTWTLSQAVYWAVDNGADIINSSWGGEGDSQIIRDAFQYAYDNGVVSVVAAGNNHADAMNYMPAMFDTAITVGAMTWTNGLAGYSNYGSKIDVVAPGSSILSLRASGTAMSGTDNIYQSKYLISDGTSMAAPQVSGVVALIKANHPEYTAEKIRQLLRSNADDLGISGFDNDFGYGRVNLFNCLKATGTIPNLGLTSFMTNPTVVSQLKINGYANGDVGAVDKWAIYYWQVGSSSKNQILNSGCFGDGNINSIDCNFDTSVLNDGDYFVQLKVVSSNGRNYFDTKKIVVNNIAISNISNGAYYRLGGIISIEGIVNNQNYVLEWSAKGSGVWSSQGVTLGQNVSLYQSSVLGTWNTASLIQGYYSLRLSTGVSSEIVADIYLSANLLNGWPKSLGAVVFNTPTISDLNNDGNLEIISGDMIAGSPYWNGVAQVYKYDGTSYENWPQFLSNDGDLPQMGIIAGNLDNDASNTEEVVIPTTSIDGSLYIYSHTGALLTKKKLLPNYSYNCSAMSDLNNDGYLEMIVTAYYSPEQIKMFVLDRSGNILNSWDSLNIESFSCPVISDLYNDGQKEIVINASVLISTSSPMYTRDGYILVYDIYGNLKWQKKLYTTPLTTQYQSRAEATPVVADVNSDGHDEIIANYDNFTVSTSTGVSTYKKAYIVIDYLGNVVSQWSVNALGNSYEPPVLANMDSDSDIEIIGSDYQNVYVWNYDGSQIFKTGIEVDELGQAHIGIPGIGDVTGDGKPDIVVQTYKGCSVGGCTQDPILYVINNDGSILHDSGWPKRTSYSSPYYSLINTPPSVFDLNKDGKNEIVFSDYWYLYAWSTNGLSAKTDWPMFQHDNWHTGNYGSRKIDQVADLRVNGTSTISNSTSSVFDISVGNFSTTFSSIWYKLGTLPQSSTDGNFSTSSSFKVTSNQREQNLYVWLANDFGYKDSLTATSVKLYFSNTSPTSTISNLPATTTRFATTLIIVTGTDVEYYKYKLDNGTWGNETATSSSIEIQGLLDGVHSIFVIGRDLAGNWQATSTPTTYSWTVDTLAPNIIGLSDDLVPRQEKVWAWNSNENNVQYRYVIDQNSSSTLSGNYSLGTSTSLMSGDGKYYLHIQAVDIAGNESNIIVVSTIIDRISPTSTLSSLPATTTKFATTSIMVSGTDVEYYKYKLDDGSWSNETATSSPIEIQGLLDGTHEIFVIGRDLAGNWQATSTPTTYSWTVDTLAPMVVLGNLPVDQTTANNISVIATGTDVIEYKYKIDNDNWSEKILKEVSIIVNGLATGLHQLFVVGSDFAGNWQSFASSTQYSWTIINSQPVGGGGSSGSGSSGNIVEIKPPVVSSSSPSLNNSSSIIKVDQKVQEEVDKIISISNKQTEFIGPLPEKLSEQTAIANSGGEALNNYISSLKIKKDEKAQTEWLKKTDALVKTDKKITQAQKYAINNFIVYGTKSTQVLSRDQRHEVIASYQDTFGKLPKNDKQWADVILISSGKKPVETRKTSEKNATIVFKKLYQRVPNLKNNVDKQAVDIIAYELQPRKKDLKAEKAAEVKFKKVFGKKPVSLAAKAIVRSIAYSGVKK